MALTPQGETKFGLHAGSTHTLFFSSAVIRFTFQRSSLQYHRSEC